MQITTKQLNKMKKSAATTITVKEKYSTQEYTVTVEKNKSVKIDCTYRNAMTPVPTSKSFNMGDIAEYDSWNLSYLGVIVGITEKVVTIQPKGDPGVKRLKMNDFCYRNWNFDLADTMACNLETSQSI